MINGCSGYGDKLSLSTSLTKIGKQAFSLTSFSFVLYEGENEPECDEDIGFPSNQIIYITDKYKNDSFCQYKIENVDKPTIEPSFIPTIDPTLNPTIEPTIKPNEKVKISKAVIVIIAICSILIITTTIIIIVFINKRKPIKQPDINPQTLLDMNTDQSSFITLIRN